MFRYAAFLCLALAGCGRSSPSPSPISEAKAEDPQPNPDPERRAAEWILKSKGSVNIVAQGVEWAVTSPEELPQGPFKVVEARLGRSCKFGKSDARHLKELPHLKILEVADLDAAEKLRGELPGVRVTVHSPAHSISANQADGLK